MVVALQIKSFDGAAGAEQVTQVTVEVPQEDKLRLYKGQHTKQEALDFLEQNGFVIDRVTSQVNEDNLYFVRKT